MATVIHPLTTTTTTTTISATLSLFPHPSNLHYTHKPPPPQIFSYLSPSKAPHRLSKSKTQPLSFFTKPSLSLSKPPPLQPISTSKPQSYNFSRLLNLSVQYNDLELTKTVHASILKLEENTYMSNALIVAYLKLGRLNYAQKVFEAMISPDVVSYTAMISGLAKASRENEAIDLFHEMRRSGIEPNEYSFVALLTACIRLLDIELGLQAHALVMKLGYLDFTYVANALMGLYSKCNYLDYVVELFSEMSCRDIASWNTVISCMVKKFLYQEAFELFRDMLTIDGLRVDYFTISSLLCACSGCFAVMEGRELHAHAIKIGYGSNLSVNNALIVFYSKCGSVNEVRNLFEKMPVRDVITWTEMVTAYMEYGLVDKAVEVFDSMPEKNSVSYNALLAGYCKNGEGSKALSLFRKMVEEGEELTDFTLTSVLNACGLIMEKGTSEQIHGFVIKFGFGENESIEAALLDMCTRCGRMAEAENLCQKFPSRLNNPVTLTSMMCGFARNGELEKAISLFCRSQSEESLVLDEVATATVLGVCGSLGFHEFGEQMHSWAVKSGFLCDVGVGNAIVSMYSKCGKIEDAVKIFDTMPAHDIISWNCLMAGHIIHRQGDDALVVWAKMEQAGMRPDSVTCLLVISAYRCTNKNLVDHCRSFFFSMKSTYQLDPNSEHYACLVSVFGYWGLLNEAEEIVSQMPFEPEPSVWRALLDSCRLRVNTTIGKRVVKKILSIEPQDPSTYILKSNLYSASGRWHCSEIIKKEMRDKGIQKLPARSWIVYENKIHSFFARDKSHPQSKDIYSGLEILIMECLKVGYAPDTSFVLHEVEEYQKRDFLFYHSSKLAVTFGLLMTRPGKPVRVTKSIVLCGDCHTFFKYVSVITKREIHVRDASGFHCFVNGKCSCKDYW